MVSKELKDKKQILRQIETIKKITTNRIPYFLFFGLLLLSAIFLLWFMNSKVGESFLEANQPVINSIKQFLPKPVEMSKEGSFQTEELEAYGVITITNETLSSNTMGELGDS